MMTGRLIAGLIFGWFLVFGDGRAIVVIPGSYVNKEECESAAAYVEESIRSWTFCVPSSGTPMVHDPNVEK